MRCARWLGPVAVLMRDYILAAKSMQAIAERIDARGGPGVLRKVA